MMASLPPEYPLLSKAQVAFFRALKQGKQRRGEQAFLLEGVRLCSELFRSDLQVLACLTLKGFDSLKVPDGFPRFIASQLQLEQISDHQTPQGILCVARIPAASALPEPERGKILLVLDRMADPGNLGTILRSALWFGVSDILLGPGCVDPYSPKVVRSSMGAIAFLKLHFCDDLLTEARRWSAAGGEIAVLDMQGLKIEEWHTEQGLFLILGSEAHGVAPELLEVGIALSIHRRGAGESLNAATAAAIALYELSKEIP